MPLEQLKFQPIDLQVHGDPSTGEVWLHYKTDDSKAISIQLSPKLLAETLLNLFLCSVQSELQDVRDAAHQLATRELHAKVLPGPFLALEQELECGVSMTMTLDPKDAATLLLELQEGLSVVHIPGSSLPH